MIGMRMHAAICAIAILVSAGCGKSPTEPSGDLAGKWSGPIAGTAAGDGTVQLVLTQTGNGLAGTYTLAYADTSKNQSGAAGGTVLGATVALTMTPARPLVCSSSVTLSGTLAATLTMSASDRLDGTYAAFACDGAIGGSIALQRQP